MIRSLILLIFGASLSLLALHRLRRYKLKERYALLFVVLGLPFLVFAFLPAHTIYRIALLLEMDPSTLIILGVAIFLILLVFELLTIVSQQDQRITTLAQMVGILNEKIEKAERDTGTNGRSLSPSPAGRGRGEGTSGGADVSLPEPVSRPNPPSAS